MLQLYELKALDRSSDLLREAESYRRRAQASGLARSASSPLATARWSAGRTLTGLGKRIAGAA